LDTPIPKTTLVLHIISCTTLVKEFDCPWSFWYYKQLKVVRRNRLLYAQAISIAKKWPTWSPTRLKSLNLGSNMRASMLWALENLKESMKLRKGLRTITHLLLHVNTKLFHLGVLSMSLTTLTFACNSNLSLESCTYNLITNTRASNNSQYP